MIIVSACLCGIDCKYNGKNNLNEEVLEMVKRGEAIPICPEQLGGLQTPRVPCEIQGGTGKDVLLKKVKILNKEEKDCTDNYIKGAFEALKIAKMVGATKAILKAKSPSCGCSEIYDGTFTGIKVQGEGVTAALFRENNIEVIDENCLRGQML